MTSNSTMAPTVPSNSTNATLAPTMAPTIGYPLLPEGECYSDLLYLYNANIQRNPFEEATFVICPNTVYQIGFPGQIGGDPFVDGFPPLELRQNSRILCGFDGKSSNNCVLRGGQFQVFTSIFAFNQEDKVNIEVQGLTFEDGGAGGLLMVAGGDVTFIDCIVQVSQAVSCWGSDCRGDLARIQNLLSVILFIDTDTLTNSLRNKSTPEPSTCCTSPSASSDD